MDAVLSGLPGGEGDPAPETDGDNQRRRRGCRRISEETARNRRRGCRQTPEETAHRHHLATPCSIRFPRSLHARPCRIPGSGHIHIAQPPLYRVERGRRETYFRDEGWHIRTLLLTFFLPPDAGADRTVNRRDHADADLEARRRKGANSW